jgi:hypothetical protein
MSAATARQPRCRKKSLFFIALHWILQSGTALEIINAIAPPSLEKRANPVSADRLPEPQT